MRPRSELHTLLKTLSENVYFQPPETVSMIYPCIVYERSNAATRFADDRPYLYDKRYQITVIDKNPDSSIPDQIAKLPQCVFNRHFRADNLNHDVFVMYF
jgi:hypothetical protein